MELVRQTDWQDDPLTEVDLVIERRDGTIIGIEVKAAASVNASDLLGLKYLLAISRSS